MRVDRHLGVAGKSRNKASVMIPVVSGASLGRIRSTARAGLIHEHTVSAIRCINPVFSIEWHVSSGRKLGVRAVQMKQTPHDRGWRFLQECYESEDDTDGWEAWLEWHMACATGQAHGPMEFKDADGRLRKIAGHSFPDEMLPQYVRDLRENRSGPVIGGYVPPKRAPSIQISAPPMPPMPGSKA